TAGAVAAARRPPIRGEGSVIEKTQARVISSQRDTGSMARSRGRLPGATIWRQLSSSPLSPGAAGAVPSGGAGAMIQACGGPGGAGAGGRGARGGAGGGRAAGEDAGQARALWGSGGLGRQVVRLGVGQFAGGLPPCPEDQ